MGIVLFEGELIVVLMVCKGWREYVFVGVNMSENFVDIFGYLVVIEVYSWMIVWIIDFGG